MAELDTIGIDQEVAELMEQSYKLLQDRSHVQIISDKHIIEEISGFFSSIKLSSKRYSFFTKNIIQVGDSPGRYIVHCLLDYGYSGIRSGQQDNGIDIEVWGYAKLKDDFGTVLLRPETGIDKIVNRFFPSDIDFPENEKFSDRYYLVSSESQKADKLFSPQLLNILAMQDDINLYINKHQLIAGIIDESISIKNTLFIEKILSAINA